MLRAVFLVPALLFPSVVLAASAVTRLEWKENILTMYAPDVPGGRIETLYLEAFCRTGSTDRDWQDTVIPHATRQVAGDDAGQHLQLESQVEPCVRVTHDIRIVEDGVSFDLVLHNTGNEAVDIDWAQPCMRVGEFTGLGQPDYFTRCFIYTEAGQVMLDKIPRKEEARYRGGQIYVPRGVNLNDVNPRPISTEVPIKNLIGCFSSDGKWTLATAWDHTQELFQGVIVCIHADFRIGGLQPGEQKRLRGKVYLVPGDSAQLSNAYKRDFVK